MLEIKPFCGLRFDPAVTGCLDAVITPPYDVITPEERDRLAAGSPWNMTHVILPKAGPEGGSPYDSAARTLAKWKSDNGLRRDDTPSYYLLRQTFTDLDGQTQVRRAFFAAVKLPEAGERHILGHERTFDKPVEDRLLLTRATRTSLGAVFVLYSDPEARLAAFLGQMDARPADLTATTFEGVRQELWRVAEDPAVAPFFPGHTLYIADGHHRFRTACTYRDEIRAREGADGGLKPYDYALMGFVAFEDPGLQVYAAHRVVKECAMDHEQVMAALAPWFDAAPAKGDLAARVKDAPDDGVFGLVTRDHGQWLLTFKGPDRAALLGDDRAKAWRDLDVALLHRGIFERILGQPEGAEYGYEKFASGAVAAVREGGAPMAFLLRATRADQIRACAEAGEPMPQKSTYFFPKLCTGAVMYPLD